MLSKIRNFLSKYRDLVIYLFFGGLTTLVNFLVYFPLYNWMSVSATVSNILAWAVAVVFAYLTNKPFVFQSKDWSMRTVIPEFAKFLGCRIGSGIIETGLIWFTVDFMMFNGNIMKVLISVLVVILNYISSKWIVFMKKQ